MSSYADGPRRPPTSPVLIVLTSAFPYGRGEEFLESEISYLSKSFERVIIAPQQITGNRRPLPANVSIDTALSQKPASYIKVVAAIAWASTSREVYLELLQHPRIAFSARAIKRLLTYNYISIRTRRWLTNSIRRQLIHPEVTVVYHYWLDATAHGVGRHPARNSLAGQVTRAHRSDIYESAHRPPYLPFRRATLAGPALVAPISTHGRAHLLEACPEAASKVEVNRLGTRDPQYLTQPSDDGVLRLVSCSYITPVKRLPLLVAALAELAALNSFCEPIEWHHLGDGVGRDEVVTAATTLLPARVSWTLHGHMTNQQVIEFYRRHPVDMFVNVSSSEGVPVSIMEAQSFGIPVLATAVGGTPEIVNSSNGYLLPRDPSPHQVARAVMRLRSRSSLETTRGQSRRSWEKSYNAAINYPRFGERLRSLAGS